MKNQLLAILALVAIATSGHAMQRAPRSFDYNTYKYNLPADAIKNYKVGETFTITNVDPKVLSPRYLKDATGKDWAANTYSHYPYSGTTTPGRGTLTFTVRAIPTAQPAAARAQILPAAAAIKAAATQQFPGQIGQWTKMPQTPGQTAGQIPAIPGRAGVLTPGAPQPSIRTQLFPGRGQTVPPAASGREPSRGTLITPAPAPLYKADIGYEEPTPGVSILRRARPVPAAQEVPTVTPSRVAIEIPAQYPTPQRAPVSPSITRVTPIGQQAGTIGTAPSRAGFITPETGKVATFRTITTPSKNAEIATEPRTLAEKGRVITPAQEPSAADLAQSAQKLQTATEKAREATQKLRETTSQARPVYYRGLDEEPSELLPLGGFGERRIPGSVMIDEPRAAASPLNDDLLSKAVNAADVAAVRWLLEKGATRNLNAALEEARLFSITERDASKKEKFTEIVKLLQAEESKKK